MNKYEKYIRDQYGLTKEPGILIGKRIIQIDSKKFEDIVIDGKPYKLAEFQWKTTNGNYHQTVNYRLFSKKYELICEIDVLYSHGHGIAIDFHELPGKPPEDILVAFPLLVWLSENRAMNTIYMGLGSPEDANVSVEKIAYGWCANDPYVELFKMINFEKNPIKSKGFLGVYTKRGV